MDANSPGAVSPSSLLPSSILDPLETPVATPLLLFAPLPDQRHAGWQRIRERIATAMYAADQPLKRIDRFCTCGHYRMILRSRLNTAPALFKVVAATCHDRLCTPCALARADLIRRNLSYHAASHSWLFLTLTVKSTSTPLRQQLADLHHAFRRLRQSHEFADHCNGGVATLELTLNPETLLWHPHLHILCLSHWIPVTALRNRWSALTGGARQLRIERVTNPRTLAAYLCKYVTKPITGKVTTSPALLPEAIAALKGSRLLVTFGRCRSWKLTTDQNDRGWEVYCWENELLIRASHDDPSALLVRDALAQADASTGEFTVDLTHPP